PPRVIDANPAVGVSFVAFRDGAAWIGLCYLGAKVLRKLRPLDIEAWHTTLRDSVPARTIGHAHRVLSKALRDAAKNDLVSRNVCKEQAAPKVSDEEMVIVRDVPALVAKLKDWRHGTVAMVALFTGTRLGRGAGAALEPRQDRP